MAKEEKKEVKKEKKAPQEISISLKWFTPKGIASEIKRIRWIKFGDLLSDTAKVLVFCILFAIFFVLCDTGISSILLLIGVGA